MSPILRYWTSFFTIYIIAICSAAYCLYRYSHYTSQIEDIQNAIPFQTNLYLLLLPLAFICTHLFSLVQQRFGDGANSKSFHEGMATLICLILLFTLGYSMQQSVLYKFKKNGYTNCSAANKQLFGSPKYLFTKTEDQCAQMAIEKGRSSSRLFDMAPEHVN